MGFGLNRRQQELLLAIAKAALPAGMVFPGADGNVVAAVTGMLADVSPVARQAYLACMRAVDASSLLRYGRRFTRLDPAPQLEVLDAWRGSNIAKRLSLRALLTPLKAAHFDNPDFYKAIGCVYEFSNKPETLPRYMRERAHDAGQLDEDLEIDCDVVVVGSGAGGAVVARELAEMGHAVVVIEEGKYFRRHEFTGRAMEMQRKLYRNAGATVAVGNTGIPIPLGRSVGGTTTINSGTCYRVPARILSHWRHAFGLVDFTEDHLRPYFDRVERVLGVSEAQPEYLGGVARVIARGCDKLGYAHGPLRRNAPDCDGKGICCFGCPTDAKRSTNVSYVPLALRAGAELFYHAKVNRILTERERATGVVAETMTSPGQRTRMLTVRAEAVVIACGSITTPVLLSESGLLQGSPALGRNLTIHPAVASLARFDEDISANNAIPQGYAIEQFHDEGLLFEGATAPLDIGMIAIPFFGPKLIELAENYHQTAAFGFLVEDSSVGRVHVVRGQPVISYRVNQRDVARIKRGIQILADVFFAAGAKAVYPLVNGFDELRSEADLARLRRATLNARDFDLTAYHPLGTARMGTDPRTSVVGPTHETHEIRGLYITDGASVPSSPAVNPQVTIMALATRAAECIDKALA